MSNGVAQTGDMAMQLDGIPINFDFVARKDDVDGNDEDDDDEEARRLQRQISDGNL